MSASPSKLSLGAVRARIAATWSSWVTFVMAREDDALPVALARIALGLTVVAHYTRFFVSGAADVALLPFKHGGFGRDGWLADFGGSTPTNVHALGIIVVVAAMFVTLGLFTKPALFVTWLAVRTIGTLNGEAKGAYDSLMVDVMFALFVSGCGRRLALDALLFRSGSSVLRWPRLLMVLQLSWLYFGSALHKASTGWVPFAGDSSALWYILQQPMWARFPDVPLWAYPITQVATTMVWLFELTGPLLIVAVLLRESDGTRLGRRMGAIKRALDRVRFLELYVAFGIAMHIGIEVTMEVGAFTFASLALYPALIPALRRQRP